MENVGLIFADITILDSAKLEMKPELSREGYLRCAVRATRAGIFEYKTTDGKIARALRPASEVFKQKSMDTAKGIPCTRKHPTELLTASTAKIFVVGATGDTAEREPGTDFLLLEANIFDGSTIEAIKAGKQEVSLGYQAKITVTPGIDQDYGPYDLIFSDIDYNHLAVALEYGEARAGHDVRMLMDSKDLKLNTTEEAMAKVKLAGADHEVTQELHDAIKNHLDGLQAQHEANQTKFAEQMSGLEREHGKLKDSDDDLAGMAEGSEGEEEDSKKADKMDSFEAKTETGKKIKTLIVSTLKALATAKAEKATLMDSQPTPEQISAMVSERARIVGTICAMDSKAVAAELLKLDNTELMKKAILLHTPKATFEGMDSARIQGQFDMVAAGVASRAGLALGTSLMDSQEQEAAATKGPKRWEAKPLSTSSRPKK